MNTRSALAALSVVALATVGCRSAGFDPAALGVSPQCPEKFEEAKGSYAWKNPVSVGGMAVGGLLGASGPAVVIAGIVLDPQPATPPVETFVIGAALASAGVATVIGASVLSSSAADDAEAAKLAYEHPCPAS
jgi:hypothetical protein